jgi:hypothetical protein
MSFSPLAGGYVHGHAQPRVQTLSGNWSRWERRRDLIGLGAELAEETLQQIGCADADVQAGVELIEREGSLNAPTKGVHCLGLERAPLLNKGGSVESRGLDGWGLMVGAS